MSLEIVSVYSKEARPAAKTCKT